MFSMHPTCTVEGEGPPSFYNGLHNFWMITNYLYSINLQTKFCGRKRASIFIAPCDIKNWKDQVETDPSKLVGDDVMVHLAGLQQFYFYQKLLE